MSGSNSVGTHNRVPPQDIEAERAVLGALLLGERAAVDLAAELLRPADFYRPEHGDVFRAMLHLHAKNEPIDAITMADELRRRQVYDGLPGGGVAFLMALGDVTFTTANVGYYARIVRDKAQLRGLIDTAGLIAGLGYSDPPDVGAALAEAEKRVLALGHGREAGAWKPLSGLLNASMEALDARYHAGGQITGLRTGFAALDLLLGGLRPGDLVIVAGRPSMGKTSIAVNAATFAALHENKRVAFVSLEMSADQITDKILCAEASVDTQQHQRGGLSDGEWRRLHDANLRLWDAPLLVEDTPDLSVPEIRSRCRRFVAEQGGVDLVIVDYLQLIRAEGRGGGENRVHEVTEMARGLKALARELNAPVVALAQLSRAVERREDKRPMLSDLRDSGGIEEAADVVLFPYRPAYYERKTAEEQQPPQGGNSDAPLAPEVEPAELIVAKNRKGRTGMVPIGFQPPFARFVNVLLDEGNPW